MHQPADELTLIEGGKRHQENKEHAFSGTAARTAGGLLVTTSDGQGIGMVWPQVLGVFPSGSDTLAIVASFCLVTLHGPGVATLARVILDRRIAELREGMEVDRVRIDKITIEGNLPKPTQTTSGFTLIELSMVLVIIGLIVGAVLVGRDMIRAAKIRATASQVEKYTAAVNVFKDKYAVCLPGDCTKAQAAMFGFPRASTAGYNNGNGYIDNDSNWNYAAEQYDFWADLSNAGLVEGTYLGYSDALNVANPSPLISPIESYFPRAKINDNTYFMAAAVTYPPPGPGADPVYGNCFVLATITDLGYINHDRSLSVQEAYGLDRKMDDGIPNTGKVVIGYPGSYLRIQEGVISDWGCTSGVGSWDFTGLWAPGFAAESPLQPDRANECVLAVKNVF
jgi:prepilin-type N-terminal cleavage/methylation domain-containing protein